MRAMRRTCTFSPTLATSAERASSTVSPVGSAVPFSASTSAAPRAASATASVKARKFSSLATKSVSELISTRAALPSAWAAVTRPSAATRLAFLSALARPCLRSHSAAALTSPLFSVSAFLHSIMPAPVRSRSSLTWDAVIWAMGVPLAGAGRGYALSWRGRVTPDLLGGGGLGRSRLLTGGGCFGSRLVACGFLLGRSLAGGATRLVTVGLAGVEVLFADAGGGRRSRLAFQHGVGRGARVQLDRADGVVVARAGVVDQGRVIVGVDHGDHRDAELLGFLDRDVLVADVDHEQGVGQAAHFLDAAQRGFQLVALAAQGQHLVLDQLVEGAVGLERLQLLQ